MKHVFVEQIPEQLADDTLYVSLEYDTVVHLCACGCRNEVVTPLSPAEWSLNYDGRSISLSPSIGNWGFACRSHYWIRRGQVDWAARWSDEKIKMVREKDRVDRDKLYVKIGQKEQATSAPKLATEVSQDLTFSARFWRWLK